MSGTIVAFIPANAATGAPPKNVARWEDGTESEMSPSEAASLAVVIAAVPKPAYGSGRLPWPDHKRTLARVKRLIAKCNDGENQENETRSSGGEEPEAQSNRSCGA